MLSPLGVLAGTPSSPTRSRSAALEVGFSFLILFVAFRLVMRAIQPQQDESGQGLEID